MHICLMTRITLEHGVRGGMERHAADLSQRLAERGHRLTAITTRHPQGKTELQTAASRILFIPDAPTGRYTAAWWRESAAALFRLHSEDPVDLVWSQSIGAYGYLSALQARLALPCVAILHGTPLGEWRGKRRQWGLSVRHLPRLARFSLRTLWHHRMFAAVTQRSDGLICVSRQLAEDVAQEFQTSLDDIAVIPNGVDASRFAPDEEAGRALRARLGVPDDASVLLTAGRLERAKGHHFALEVTAHLLRQGLPAFLLIAGGGPDEDWLKQQARSLGVAERVRWLGQVPHEKMAGVYSAADVVLMLSILTEAFPYAVVEAMACERAVVASRVGGVPTAITHGHNGVLVPPGDAHQAAGQTARLLRQEEHRIIMGQTARRAVLERFTLDGMAAATEAVFLRHAHSVPKAVRK